MGKVPTIFVSLALLAILPQISTACSCGEASPQEYAKNAKEVFIGTAISTQSSTSTNKRFKSYKSVTTFDVELTIKGEKKKRRVITSEGIACTIYFQRGDRFIVYARNGKTGLCSGSTSIGNAYNHLRLLDGDLLKKVHIPSDTLAAWLSPSNGEGSTEFAATELAKRGQEAGKAVKKVIYRNKTESWDYSLETTRKTIIKIAAISCYAPLMDLFRLRQKWAGEYPPGWLANGVAEFEKCNQPPYRIAVGKSDAKFEYFGGSYYHRLNRYSPSGKLIEEIDGQAISLSPNGKYAFAIANPVMSPGKYEVSLILISIDKGILWEKPGFTEGNSFLISDAGSVIRFPRSTTETKEFEFISKTGKRNQIKTNLPISNGNATQISRNGKAWLFTDTSPPHLVCIDSSGAKKYDKSYPKNGGIGRVFVKDDCSAIITMSDKGAHDVTRIYSINPAGEIADSKPIAIHNVSGIGFTESADDRYLGFKINTQTIEIIDANSFKTKGTYKHKKPGEAIHNFALPKSLSPIVIATRPSGFGPLHDPTDLFEENKIYVIKDGKVKSGPLKIKLLKKMFSPVQKAPLTKDMTAILLPASDKVHTLKIE